MSLGESIMRLLLDGKGSRLARAVLASCRASDPAHPDSLQSVLTTTTTTTITTTRHAMGMQTKISKISQMLVRWASTTKLAEWTGGSDCSRHFPCLFVGC